VLPCIEVGALIRCDAEAPYIYAILPPPTFSAAARSVAMTAHASP
jgi:hypothetical protein